MTPEKDQVFQFRLSRSEMDMLRATAGDEAQSAGDLLRRLIRDRFALRGSPIGVMPPGLDAKGKEAWRVVSAFAKRHKLTQGVTVHSARQWILLGHEFGVEPSSKLIVGHEGTDLGPVIDNRVETKLGPKLEA